MSLLFCATDGCEFSTSEPATSPLLRNCPRCGGKRFIVRDHAGPLKFPVRDAVPVTDEEPTIPPINKPNWWKGKE